MATPNYQIIDTDYEKYTIVYFCDPSANMTYLWYMSRTAHFDEATL